MSQSVFTSYISFVENTEQMKSQILYSPIEDGSRNEKIIYMKKTRYGYLYASLLPFDKRKDGTYNRLSETTTKIIQNGGEFLTITNDRINFKAIEINRN